MNFFGMGPLELVLILALALIIFGPDKLPEIAQQVGRAVREIRRLGTEVTDEIQKGIEPDRPGGAPARPVDSVSRTTVNQNPNPSGSILPSPEVGSAVPTSRKDPDIEPPY